MLDLLPNPTRVLRRRAVFEGLAGNSWFWGLVAIWLMRRSSLVRRKALYSGVLGDSWFWKGASVYVFGTSIFDRLFAKKSESLGRRRLGSGHFIEVRTERPTTRRERKRLARAGTPVPTIAQRRKRAEAYLANATGDDS